MKHRPLRNKPSLSRKRFGATNENSYFDTRALRVISVTHFCFISFDYNHL